MEGLFKVVILCDDQESADQDSNGFSESECYKLSYNRRRKGEHRCGVCKKKFCRFLDMKNHELLHFGSRRYECDLCSKKFGRSYHLCRHLNNIHTTEFFQAKSVVASMIKCETQPTRCEFCTLKLKTKCSLQEHMCALHFSIPVLCRAYGKSSRDIENRYQCNYCKKQFSEAMKMKNHMSVCEEKKLYKCNECGEEFYNRGSHLEHSKTHMNEDVNEGYFDEDSNEEKMLEAFGSPLQEEIETISCDVCGKAYKLLKALKEHMKIHSGEKIFKCDVCGKVCHSSQYLYRHKFRHNKRMYKCSTCSKTFLRSDHLSEHRLQVHKISKNYECDECGANFSSEVRYLKHINRHSRDAGIFPKGQMKSGRDKLKKRGTKVQCNICKKWLASSQILKKHKALHSAKHQQCEFCSKKFSKRDQLIHHQMVAHKKKRRRKDEAESQGVSKRPGATEKSEFYFGLAADEEKIITEVKPLNKNSFGKGKRGKKRGKRPVNVEAMHYCCECDEIFAEEEDILKHMKTHELAKRSETA